MSNAPVTGLPSTPPRQPDPIGGQVSGISNRNDLLHILSHGEGRINDLLNISRAKLAAMREDEQSYFSFVNAENTCGMSAWWLGRPASSFRYDAARDYVSALEDIRFSIYAIRGHIENGSLPLTKPSVRQFFDGPMGRMFDWKQILASRDGEIPEHLLTPNDTALAGGLVSLANRLDSEDMAILTAKSFQNLIPPETVKNLLPESSVVFFNDYGRDLANATVSLPQLLSYTTGAGLGIAIARSANATTTSLKVLNAMGRGRYLLPGTTLMQTGVVGTWNSHWLTRGLVNFGFNFVKFPAYAGIGYLLAGRDGMETAGAIFMGGMGVASGFTHGWLYKITAELTARDANGTLANWLLKGKMDQVARVNLSVELPGIDNVNSLKLVTAKDAHLTYKAMTAFQGELVEAEQVQLKAVEDAARRLAEEHQRLITAMKTEAARLAKAAERAAQQETKWRERLGNLNRDTEELAATLPEDEAQKLLQNVRTASNKPLSKNVIDEIQTLLNDARAAVKVAAASARTPRGTAIVARKPSPTIVKPGTRAERLAEHVPAKGLSKTVASLTDNPPDFFEDVIEALNSHIFAIDSSCHLEMVSLYENGPITLKKLIILRLSELNTASPKFGTQWKTIEGTDNRLWKGRVGLHHEITVRNNGGSFMDGPVWTVVSIRKLISKVARAVTPSTPLPIITP